MYIVSAFIAGFALYLALFPFHEAVPLKKGFSDFPLKLNGWTGKDQQFDDVILEKLRVSEYMMRQYTRDDNTVTLYIGYYSTQREGAQIHSPKHCLPGGGWFLISEATRELQVSDHDRVRYIEAVYEKGDGKEVFFYWYKMKDASITNEYKLKFFMVLNSLMYRRNDAAFIRLSAPVTGSREAAISVLEDFMKDFLPLLKDYLPE